MAKIKYRFNPDSLIYDKIVLGTKGKIFKIFTYLSASLVIAIVYYLLFSSIFNTPKEKSLKREISDITYQYENMYNRLTQMENVLNDLENRDDNIYRVIFGTDPLPQSYRSAGFGGSNLYKELEGYNNSELIVNTAIKLDELSKRMVVQSKSYDEVIKLAKNKEKMIASVPAIMPISNKNLTRTASGWGWRIHPIYKIRKFHYGMDFTSPTGTDVYTTGDGVVVQVSVALRGYGNKIIIDHGFGYQTLYGHLNGFNVHEGQEVKRGDVIGFVGSTGTSTAPHLHYEVLKNGIKINPINYYFNDLSPEEYDKMIEISANSGQTFD